MNARDASSATHFPVRETPRLLHIARVALHHGLGRYVERLPLKHAEAGGAASDTLTLDARFNMLTALHDYVPRLVGRQVLPASTAAGLAQGYRAVNALRGITGALPRAVAQALRGLERGGLGVSVRHERLDEMEKHLDRASNRLSFSLIIGAMVIGSSIVMAYHTGPHYAGIPLLGLAGYAIAAVLGLWWAVAILRSGRF